MLRPTLLILFVFSGMALAQNAPVPLVPIPAPDPVPGLVPAGGNLTRLQFPNTDVKEVLAFYERLTKKRLVIDNQVQGTVNIVIAGEIPADRKSVV